MEYYQWLLHNQQIRMMAYGISYTDLSIYEYKMGHLALFFLTCVIFLQKYNYK